MPLILSLVILPMLASSAAAQGCTTFNPPCPPDQPPQVLISPSSGSTYSTADVSVTVYASDDYGLDFASWHVTLSGATDATGNGFRFTSTSPTDGSSTNTIRLAAGSGNTITASICDVDGHCTTSSASYTYNPPPPPPEKAAPVLSTQNRSSADAARCAGCGDATVAYSTPAYTSLDARRSVTLFYSSASAHPQGFVQVDAEDHSLAPPDRMSLQLLRPDGSFVTFTTGVQEIFYASGNGTTRLAAQFDAGDLSTAAYDYTAIVRSWWGTGFLESRIPVRVLVVNGQDINGQESPYGWGWSIPGILRLTLRPDGGMIITEGDGLASFFTQASCDGAGTVPGQLLWETSGPFATMLQSAGTSSITSTVPSSPSTPTDCQ